MSTDNVYERKHEIAAKLERERERRRERENNQDEKYMRGFVIDVW